MDKNTRRLDSAVQPPEDAMTQSLNDANTAPELRCLRCDTVMEETLLWAEARSSWYNIAPMFLTKRVRRGFLLQAKQVPVHTVTCPNCGYTEIYPQNKIDLAQMLAEEIDDDKR